MGWSLVGSAGAVAFSNGSNPTTVNCGQSSTAGNLLVCTIAVNNTHSPVPILPTGWVERVGDTTGGSPWASAYIFDYINNPGSISSISVNWSGGGHFAAQIIEYTNTNVANATADQTGTITETATVISPLNIATSGNLTANHELAAAAMAVQFSAATTATLSAGTGFTQQGQRQNGNNQAYHQAFDNDLDTGASSSGSTLTDAMTVSATGAGGQVGVIATYTVSANNINGTATAPLTLGTAATGNKNSSSTDAAALTLGTATTGTTTARSGTATAPLTLGTAVNTIAIAHLSLGTAALGVKHANDGGGSAASSAVLSLAVTQVVTDNRIGTAFARLPLSTPRYPLHLGGTVVDSNMLGGSVTDTAAQWAYGPSTLTIATNNGSATIATNNGTLDEWTMTPINITLAEFNDEQLTVNITSNSSPVNLTGYTINALFKTKAGVADSDPSTITLSSAGGSPPITITNAAQGQLVVNLPSADLQNANITFWRLDTIDTNSKRATAIYGTVTVTLL